MNEPMSRRNGAPAERSRLASPVESAEVDEYRLLRLLGSGAMGTVYLAHDTLLDRAVAIKFLSVSRTQNAQRSRFLTEARALARMHHPNIVSVYRTGEHAGQPYLVSEYVRGQPLSALKTPLPAATLRKLALGLCRGLHAAHRGGVLHRDIKPANAILAEDENVKLLDFGLAKLVEGEPAALQALSASQDSEDYAPERIPHLSGTRSRPSLGATSLSVTASLSETEGAGPSARFPEGGPPRPLLHETKAGTRLGTPLYMAPELWRGEPASVRSDLYALGALLYELACGCPPHTGSSLPALERAVLTGAVIPLSQRVPGFDGELAELIEQCLHPRPNLRPVSVTQLLSKLESPQRHSVVPSAASSPYRGLPPFDAEHRAFFLGRSAEVHEVVNLLRTRSLVVISGNSGVGKSSLCRAGVLPTLTEGALADARTWQVIRVVPGRRPVLALASALAPHIGLTSDETLLLCETDTAALLRGLILRLDGPPVSAGEPRRGLILFIDQLEELVSQSGAHEGPLFGALLSEFFTLVPALRVLTTLRGDFLFRVMEATGLHQDLAQALYVLPPLSAAALEEVITGPAHLCGVAFEEPAQSALMAQSAARAEGGLPLLQFALAELWELRDTSRQLIPACALDRIGGVAGALARYADEVLNRLPPHEHQAAHQLLTRLVTAAGTRTARTRTDLLTGSPSTQAAASVALEALVRARLLVARQSPVEGAVYEIAHEALLQGWATLRNSITQDFDRRAVAERLELATAEWVRLGRSSQALWQNRQLAELDAVELHSDELPPRAGDFLAASRRAARRQRLLRYGLTVLIVPTLLGIRSSIRWYSSGHARTLIAGAEEALGQAHVLRTQTAKLQAQAYARFDAQDIARGNLLFQQALALRQATTETYQRVQADAYSALTLRDDMPQAARLIQQSSYERDLLLRAFASGAPADHDSSAQAHVSLNIRPYGTTVSLQRADGNTARRGWLAEEPLGVTPIRSHERSAGSYLLTLRTPDSAEIRYPIYLYAGEDFTADFALPNPSQVPAGMVYIPPGRFLYGSGDDEEIREWLGAQPLHPVHTRGYFISRHEVTYREWINFLESLSGAERELRTPSASGEKGNSVSLMLGQGGADQLILKPMNRAYSAMSGDLFRYAQRNHRQEQDWRQFPVSGISQEDAQAYADWLSQTGRVPGARLCTEHEWERAARGADARQYPSGDTLEKDDANIDITYDRQPEAFGPDAVGSHAASNSPFGVADLAGNVREWVKSVNSSAEYVYRDGSFYYSMRTSHSTNRQTGARSQHSIFIGARICANGLNQ